MNSLLILTGPQGAGKTTLAEALVASGRKRFARVITHTTRPPRPGEIDGVHYHFVCRELFEAMEKRGQLLAVSGNSFGHRYGIHFPDLCIARAGWPVALVVLDIPGALELAPRMNALTVFVRPPSKADLYERLMERHGRPRAFSPEIYARAMNALEQFGLGPRFDCEVVSDDLAETVRRLRRLTYFGEPAARIGGIFDDADLAGAAGEKAP